MRFPVLALVISSITMVSAGIAIAQEPNLTAQVVTKDGQDAGTVVFEQVSHGVVITADLKNLPEGPHAFHVHEHGACEPTFDAAGGHYSPTPNEHGFDNPEGYHAGDLPNLYVDDEGTAKADFFAPHLTLAPDTPDPAELPFTLLDESGSALIIHENIDDYTADNSTGPRIACGVIVPSEN